MPEGFGVEVDLGPVAVAARPLSVMPVDDEKRMRGEDEGPTEGVTGGKGLPGGSRG